MKKLLLALTSIALLTFGLVYFVEQKNQQPYTSTNKYQQFKYCLSQYHLNMSLDFTIPNVLDHDTQYSIKQYKKVILGDTTLQASYETYNDIEEELTDHTFETSSDKIEEESIDDFNYETSIDRMEEEESLETSPQSCKYFYKHVIIEQRINFEIRKISFDCIESSQSKDIAYQNNFIFSNIYTPLKLCLLGI